MTDDGPDRVLFTLLGYDGGTLRGGAADVENVFNVFCSPEIGSCSRDRSLQLTHDGTASSLLASLESALADWAPADELIFYYTGHGPPSGTYNFQLGDGAAGRFSFNWLLDLFRDTYNVTRAIIIVDACYSGRLTSARVDKATSPSSAPLVSYPDRPAGMAILTSSRWFEPSEEDQTQSGSVFTIGLCEQLREGLPGEFSAHSHVSVDALHSVLVNRFTASETQIPCIRKDAVEGDIWVARNNSYRPLPTASGVPLLESLQSQQVSHAWELEPCPVVEIDALDDTLIERHARARDFVFFDNDSKVTRLRKLGLLAIGPTSIPQPHYAAALVFCKSQLMPEDLGAAQLCARGDDGTLVATYTARGNLIDRFTSLYQKTLEYLADYAGVHADSGTRLPRHPVLKRVVRELIGNAVAHRRYDTNSILNIDVSPTTIAVSSPGHLPNSIQWRDLLSGAASSCPVNARLASYLREFGIVERARSGSHCFSLYAHYFGVDSIKCHEMTDSVSIVLDYPHDGESPSVTDSNVDLDDSPRVTRAVTRPPFLAQRVANFECLQASSPSEVQFVVEQIRKSTVGKLDDAGDEKLWQALAVSVGSHLKSLRYVRTLWRFDQLFDLLTLYQSTSIELDGTQLDSLEAGKIHSMRLLLTGGPGSGKSTTLRMIAVQAPTDGMLPAFVQCRDWRQEQPDAHAFLLEAIAAFWGTHSTAQLGRILVSGYALLCVDSLDEIDPTRRAEFCRGLDRFADEYPRIRIIVTSRPLLPASGLDGFERATMLPLTRYQAEGLLARVAPRERVLRGEEVLDATRGFPSHPLPIIITAILWKNIAGGHLSRAAFFEGYIEMITRRHDAMKLGFKRSHYSEFNTMELLQIAHSLAIAFKLRRVQVASFEVADEMLKSFSQHASVTTFESKAVIEDLCESMGILTVDEMRIEFVHSSLLSYLAAKQLASMPDEVASRFLEKLAGPEWRSWEDELDLLQELSPGRFENFFVLPATVKLINYLDTGRRAQTNVATQVLKAVGASFGLDGDSIYDMASSLPWVLDAFLNARAEELRGILQEAVGLDGDQNTEKPDDEIVRRVVELLRIEIRSIEKNIRDQELKRHSLLEDFFEQ